MFSRGTTLFITGEDIDKRTLAEHFSRDHTPKPILALDDG